MTDKRRETLQEQYEEAALSLMMDEIAEEEGQQLLQKFEMTEQAGALPEIPDALDEKNKHLIRNTFQKQQRKARSRRATTRFAMICVYVCLFLGLATALVYSVDAIRIPVMNFYFTHEERFTSAFFGEENTTAPVPESLIDRFIAAPIPPDYELIIERYEENNTAFLCFKNQESALLSYTTYTADSIINFDTENAKVTQTEICGHSATFVEKDEYRLLWLDEGEGLLCDLYASDLDRALFWEIAEVLAQ